MTATPNHALQRTATAVAELGVVRRFCARFVKRLITVLLLITSAAFAAPRDVRRVFADNYFLPDQEAFQGPVIAYSEPRMATWSYKVGETDVFVSAFDPPPTVSTTLSTKQARQLAAILADRHTYNGRSDLKACQWHPDVAIRIPEVDGIYVVICFTCNQLVVQQRGIQIASADIDRGRNRLLMFVRSIFPSNTRFKKLPIDEHRYQQRDWAKAMLKWAQTIIPEDPLLKRSLELKPEDVSEDDLEELDIRCLAQWDKWQKESADKRKEQQKRGER